MNKELFNDGDVKIELDLDESKFILRYVDGDTIGIYPTYKSAEDKIKRLSESKKISIPAMNIICLSSWGHKKIGLKGKITSLFDKNYAWFSINNKRSKEGIYYSNLDYALDDEKTEAILKDIFILIEKIREFEEKKESLLGLIRVTQQQIINHFKETEESL